MADTPPLAGRLDVAIAAAADALLTVCAVQTGTDPAAALDRAMEAIAGAMSDAEARARKGGLHAGDNSPWRGALTEHPSTIDGRLCAHADDDAAPAHWLGPGERCDVRARR
jgi:hypothetical protein